MAPPPPPTVLAYAFHEFAYEVCEQRVQVSNLSSPEVGASLYIGFRFYMVLIYKHHIKVSEGGGGTLNAVFGILVIDLYSHSF